jgi:hypothetical protein
MSNSIQFNHDAPTLHEAIGIPTVREVAKKTGPITAEFMLSRLTNIQVAELLYETCTPAEILFLATMELQGNAALAANLLDKKV